MFSLYPNFTTKAMTKYGMVHILWRTLKKKRVYNDGTHFVANFDKKKRVYNELSD